MIRALARFLGLLPDPPKTGGREMALFVLLIALGLTITAFVMEVISESTGLLVVIWPTALGYTGYAYKLKSDTTEGAIDDLRRDVGLTNAGEDGAIVDLRTDMGTENNEPSR